MKTPEEIKVELKEEIPVHYHLPNPEARLRYTDLMKLQNLHACTLTYIQQLEADLQREKDQHQYTIDAANVMKDEALKFESRLAQVERERDIAIAALDGSRFCGDCLHSDKKSAEYPCCDCLKDEAESKPFWQFGGVCPENTKEE